MGYVQMSHLVENDRILKVSFLNGLEDATGVSWGIDVCVVGEDADEGEFSVMRRMGSKGWVQHRPRLTQKLQKPQSPSLHLLHFQKQSFAVDWHVSQKRPLCRRRAGLSLVICRSPIIVL